MRGAFRSSRRPKCTATTSLFGPSLLSPKPGSFDTWERIVNLSIVQPLPQSVCQHSDQLRLSWKKMRPVSTSQHDKEDCHHAQSRWNHPGEKPLPRLLIPRSPNSLPCHRRAAKIPPTCSHFPEVLTASCYYFLHP
jgi:hypothetical protein